MRILVFKILYILYLHKFYLLFKRKEIITLMFHRINYYNDLLWPALKPSSFNIFIKLIKKNFEIIPITKISDYKKIDKNLIIMTFDDGYKDFIKFALPIIKKYKISANLNICPNLINEKKIPWTQKINLLLTKKNIDISKLFKKYNLTMNNNILNEKKFNNICNQIHQLDSLNYINFFKDLDKIEINDFKIMLDWNDIKYCLKNNITIGNHSSNHINLNKLNSQELSNEIIESKIQLEKELQTKINIFSIPNGMINNKAQNIILDHYKFILFSDDDRKLFNKNKNTYELNRINISINNPYEEFFRAIGLHQSVKKTLRFFFKLNNES